MGEFTEMFLSLLNNESIFNEILNEIDTIYKEENNQLLIDDVKVFINKNKKLIKINENYLNSLGEYKSLKKNNNQIIIEFDEYIVKYNLSDNPKLIIEGLENEI